MLTKDLVRYRIRKQIIYPQYIDASNPDFLETAGELIAIFDNGLHQTREAIQEQTSQIIEASPCEAIISRGFEKLLFDRSEFQEPDDADRPQMRDRIFRITSQALSSQSFESREAYENWVTETLKKPARELGEQLYADLPGQHPLTEFKPITPLQLVNRYNTSGVQWLLLSAHQLKVTLSKTTPAAMRQLLKYLRFTQLLAKVTRPDRQTWIIHIDGPMNLFGQTRRYGMNLARFFPALLHQDQWHLEANLQLTPRIKPSLILDQDCKLRPERERFHAYVPKEIELFKKSLKQKMADWKCDATPGFVPLEGEHLCFPDFTLTHHSGRKVAIELFHPWHATHFTTRLAQVANLKEPPLILGIDYKLAKDPLVSETLSESPYFKRYGFVFRDLPTIQKVGPILEALIT